MTCMDLHECSAQQLASTHIASRPMWLPSLRTSLFSPSAGSVNFGPPRAANALCMPNGRSAVTGAWDTPWAH